MNSTSKPCPDQQTLLQFIQGRLEPPTLDQCEDHVSGCQSCHETLRGLDANDTLSHYVSDALEQQPPENQSDTQAIDGLMQRLLQPGGAGRPSAKRSSSNVEIMADRAAEVLRCVEAPAIGDEDSLGTLGDYRLLRLIGAGGTGVVFQAKDISLDRVVALKVLRPSLGDIARDRFIAEARLAASIEHDNVVTIYQIGQEDRLAFIAMQWLPGETLEARLNRESGTLSEETIRELVGQIASGLSAAHQRQLIHRDIKPANIWICEDTGRIKILDFGLARITDEESSLTQTGMLAGTPSFMSPEQARGMELDPRTDLFSLGCVMYLLLTGRLPFSAPTVLGTLQTIQSDSPQPPIAVDPSCNADLSDLTMSLLEKLPGNRLASAENLISSLNNPRPQWPQKVAVASTVAHKVSGKALAAGPDSTRSSTNSFRWLIATSLLAILGVTGWLMAPQIFRIITDQGELVVETSDENIKIEVLENGSLFRVLDASTKDSFDIRSGKYSFNVVSKDNQNKFEVTPKSVTMTRGGKQLVTVTISQPETEVSKANSDVSIDELLNPNVGAETQLKEIDRILAAKPDARQTNLSPAEFMSNLLAEKRRIDSTYGSANSPEKRQAEIQAAIAGLRMQRDQMAEKLGPGNPTIQSFDSQIASMEKHLSSSTSRHEQPIYGGRDFRQWLRIARKDREPKTLADAIAACGVLAEGEQKPLFIADLRKLVRRYGSATSERTDNGGVPNDANIFLTGFLKAMDHLEPNEVVEFIQGEMDSGNERSLGFCSRIFPYLDFGGDTQTSFEFREIATLDTTKLMNRIRDRELKFGDNLRTFFESIFSNATTTVDASTCIEAAMTSDIEDRPWIFLTMLLRFHDGELNETIESEFFADSTPGLVREYYITGLFNYEHMHHGSGGGGIVRLGPPSQNRCSLIIQILTKAIARVATPEEPKLEFDALQDIWFDENVVIPTATDSTGANLWSLGGVFSKAKPKGAVQIQGRAAIVRHLLTRLCRVTARGTLQDKDRELLRSFVKEMTQSKNKAVEDLMDGEDFQELQIEKDLKNLRDAANGEATEYDFTRFTKDRFFGVQGGHGQGGHGQGGHGQGGGGGVF